MQTQRCSRVFSCSKPPLLLPWGQGGREAWVPVSHLLLLFRFKADYNWEESCNMANPPLSQAGSGNQKARGNVTCFPQGKSERHKLFMQIWSVFRRVLRKISGNHFLITHIDCTYCACIQALFSQTKTCGISSSFLVIVLQTYKMSLPQYFSFPEPSLSLPHTSQYSWRAGAQLGASAD